MAFCSANYICAIAVCLCSNRLARFLGSAKKYMDKDRVLMKLQGKYALVTGAGSGIGQATALLFAQECAHIIAADMNAEALQATQQKMAERGLQVETTVLNVT